MRMDSNSQIVAITAKFSGNRQNVHPPRVIEGAIK